jgi:hypothetical protein
MPMQKDEFIAYMSNPASLDDKSLNNLKEILREYPYFQAAHLLLVKNLSNLGHMKFDSQLRLSAAYVGNRQLLFRLISESSTIPQDQPIKTNEPIKTEGSEISVHLTIPEPGVKEEEKKEEKSIADIVLEQVKEMKESLEKDIPAEKGKEPEQIASRDTGEFFEIDDKLEITEAGPAMHDSVSKSRSMVDLLVIDEKSNEGESESTEPAGKKKLREERKTTTSLQKKTSLEKEIHLHETHSFTSWLSLFREEEFHSQNKSDFPRGDKRKNKNDLIEDFITKQPRMEKPDMLAGNEKVEDISKHSLMESEDFITETLAKIYVKQKKYDKAISFYEKLSLKYPEKVSYFADQIEEIKKLLTNNS